MKVVCQLAFLLLALRSFGQFQITLLPTTPNELHFEQLWKFDVLSQYASPKSVRIIGTLEDENGIAVQAASAQIALAPGINTSSTLQAAIRPLHFDLIRPEYQQSISSSSGFPPGQYQWCVEIEEVLEQQFGAQACQTIVVTAFVPPHLIIPADESEINEPRPVFVWSPPIPASPSALTYTIKIVELKNAQVAEAAIISNAIHFQLGELRSPVLSYPASAKSFEVGKKYAWTVVAYLSGQPIPAEEVWVFSPADTAKKAATVLSYYAVPKATLDGDFVTLEDGHLRFAFNSRYGDEQVGLQVLDAARSNHLRSLISDAPNVKVGYNRFDIDLRCALEKTGYYALEITGKSGNRYLRFYYSVDAEYNQDCGRIRDKQ